MILVEWFSVKLPELVGANALLLEAQRTKQITETLNVQAEGGSNAIRDVSVDIGDLPIEALRRQVLYILEIVVIAKAEISLYSGTKRCVEHAVCTVAQ